jgi:hypothetical protein
MVKNIILKAEQILEVLDPVIIMVLGAAHLSDIIPTFQTWEAVVLAALGAASLIAGIVTTVDRGKK